MKIAFTDIETSGLSATKQDVLEIGCVIADEVTLDIIEVFEFKVKPRPDTVMKQEALDLNGYNEHMWKDALSPEEAALKYAHKTQGTMFCAHNATFDYAFITAMADRADVALFLDKYKLDTMSMARMLLPRLGSYSLKSMCEVLKIEPEPDIHRALSGAMKCYEVYKGLMAIRNA